MEELELDYTTLNNLVERRSCRDFSDKAVPEDVLNDVITAGMYAPTGMGKQSPIIIQVSNPKLRAELMEENRKIGGWEEGFDPFYGAPVILIVLADKNIPTHVYDGSLVMGNLMNAAHSLGLGSIWIHRAKEEFESEWGLNLLKKLGIEGEYEGIGHCAIGYAKGETKDAAPRKDNYVFAVV